MGETNLLQRIKQRYNLLTKAEKKVADYVMSEPEKALYMSISDLAEACELGETSVFRFCKSMKLKGYQDFRMQLSFSISQSDNAKALGQDTLADPFTAKIHSIYQNNISAIQEGLESCTEENFMQIIEKLVQASSIHFYGVGSSMLLAQEAMNLFLHITPKVKALNDSHMQAMSASLLNKNDVAIVISYSGNTRDTIQIAQLAKSSGAYVLAITHHAKSILTQFTDHVLLSGSKEGPLQGGSTSAKLSQMFLIELLYQFYYEQTKEISHLNNQRTAKSVMEKLF